MRGVRVFLFIALACCVSVTCQLDGGATQWQPRWKFHGGGFHRFLEIDIASWMDDVNITIELPKTFFFDVPEVWRHYRILGQCTRQGSAQSDIVDLVLYYKPPLLVSSHVFNIEAPTFHLSYDINVVSLSIKRHSVLPLCLNENVHLVLPIHLRYEDLDTETPLSLAKFTTSQDSFVQRCLTDISVQWDSTQKGRGAAFADARRFDQKQCCASVPVGILSNLPFVYNTLIFLLVFSAFLIVVSV